MIGLRQSMVPIFGVVAVASHALAAQPQVPAPLASCDAQKSIFFEYESVSLSREALIVISETGRIIRLQGQVPIRITGYAGASEKDAQALSERRATVVRETIGRGGLDGYTIETNAVGSSHPFGASFNSDPEAFDRRAVIDWPCPNG